MPDHGARADEALAQRSVRLFGRRTLCPVLMDMPMSSIRANQEPIAPNTLFAHVIMDSKPRDGNDARTNLSHHRISGPVSFAS